MLLKLLIILWTIVGNCQAGLRFTTDIWEVQQEKPLILEWADANGAVNVTLVKVTTSGVNETNKIAHNCGGNKTSWTPRSDITGKFVLQINDGVSTHESPQLSLLDRHLKDANVPRDESDDDTSDDDNKANGNDGLPPGTAAGIGVGSTVGGIFLLAVLAILIYRGRQNRTRLDDQEAGEHSAGKQKQREPQSAIRGAFHIGQDIPMLRQHAA